MGLAGGDVRQFTYAGREFDVSTDADVTIVLAGQNLSNTSAGNGRLVSLGKRRLGGLMGLVLVMRSERKDLEFLVNIQSTGEPKPWSLTEAGGITYAGTGLPEGDGLGKSTASGVATFDLMGEKAEQI